MAHHPAVAEPQALSDLGDQAGLPEGLKIDRQVRPGEQENADGFLLLKSRQGLGHLAGQPAGLGLPGGELLAAGKERQPGSRPVRGPGAGGGGVEAQTRHLRPRRRQTPALAQSIKVRVDRKLVLSSRDSRGIRPAGQGRPRAASAKSRGLAWRQP